ncbi:MAG: DNA-directed RNA polymerase subunit omega [Alphaproteobacteria bacterium]|nr:DNA-directed RNA polymerase subunit omega [Alphaproteobacteria bacterium]
MARVTVEDCVNIVPNRFDLILTAAGRAKSLDSGAPLTVSRDNDKNTIIALREIEEKTIDVSQIRENMITGMQRYAHREAPVETTDLAVLEGETSIEQLYSDAEFVDSDSFQVVDSTEA